MKHSQVSHTQSPKLTLSGTSVVEVEAVVGTVVAEGVAAIEVVPVVEVTLAGPVQELPLQGRSTREPSTLIFRLEIGPDVGCISSSGVLRTSVLSRRPAHGRIFTLQGHRNNDGPTSSVTPL